MTQGTLASPTVLNADAVTLSAPAISHWSTGFASASPNSIVLGLERNNAEAARQRFEARETRLERLKRERKQRIEEKKRALRE